MFLMTTDRIKNINKFIDDIITQEEWENNKNIRINDLFIKYNKELQNYNYVLLEEINNLKIGGYIKYINEYDELYWGGALVNIDSNFIYMKKDDIIKINKFKNLIFYRNHRTKTDKTREIFITSLDKYG
jgi:hypothetical protein